MLGQWVITASHRQGRTYKPSEGHCPLCPTRSPDDFPTEIPAASYEIAVFDNKFPSLRPEPEVPAEPGSAFMPVMESFGRCEVVLYTDDHNATFARLSASRIRNLVDVWADRYLELGSAKGISYVLIFENKGDAVGVTLHHPHGQIYAFPYIPPIARAELESSSDHLRRTGRCLMCDVLAEELGDGRRIVFSDSQFVAVLPFYARYPYEVHIVPRKHVPSIDRLDTEQRDSLAAVLKAVTIGYDALFGFDFPYIMVMHQAPTDSSYPGASHFHIEFYPPHRTADKLKYLAGCESGAGTFINDSLPEEKAVELREAILGASGGAVVRASYGRVGN